MRRTLEVLSLIMILVGVELSTGSVSYALRRFERVYRAIAGGNEPEVSVPMFVVGVTLFLVGSTLLAVTVWARFAQRFVVVGASCPKCGGRAKRIKRHVSHRVLGRLLGYPIVRRQCRDCGWKGLAALT